MRSVLAAASVIVLTIACGLAAIVLSLLHPRGEWVLRIGTLWGRGICAVSGVRIEARGIDNVPRDRPAILISNHQSNFDMIALIMTMPRPFRVVAKRFLFFIPVFGWCLWLAGMIPIDRGKHARAIESLEKAAARVRAGEPVLFFPEGTRSRDGGLLPFKKGAFVIAVKSGVPIVPVSVSGGHGILPKRSVRIRPGRMVVRYGPEIAVSGYTLETKERLIERVRRAVEEGLERTAATEPAAFAAEAGPAPPAP